MSLHDILHEIVDHLPINEKVKQELHGKLAVEDPGVEVEKEL